MMPQAALAEEAGTATQPEEDAGPGNPAKLCVFCRYAKLCVIS